MAHSAYIMVYLLTHQYIPICTHSSNSLQSSIITECTGSPFLSPGPYVSFDFHAYIRVTRVHHHQDLGLLGNTLHLISIYSGNHIHTRINNLYKSGVFHDSFFLYILTFAFLLIFFSHTYKYLGVIFSEHLDYEQNAAVLSKAGGRELGAIIAKYKAQGFMSYSTYTKLFDS